jgi:hypothetical protein
VIPVQAVLPEALAALIRRSPLSPEKVQFAWRTAVGPSIDGATQVTLADGQLVVQARDAAWRREVTRALPLIRPRLAALLGPETVREVVVRAR